MIGEPPSVAGGVKAMNACALPGVGVPMAGAPGLVGSGMTSTDCELALVP